jgi:glycosyltransferase involved in cell wall biosynthesis
VNQPTFSVIITTFNRPELLREAVESVLAQTVPDLECIVVDDAGSEPVDLPDDPRMRVLRHDRNRGGAAAFNTGLRAARGTYVAFLDDDDLYTPDRLAIALAAHEGTDVVVCGSKWLDAARASSPRDLQGRVFDVVLDSVTPHTGTVTVRRDAVLPFDPKYLASYDVEWWLRMAESRSVRTVGAVGCRIRRHAGVRHGNDPRARIRAGKMILDQHAEYFASHPRAAAFRWFRLGLQAARIGDRSEARKALARSLRIRWRARTAAHLVMVHVAPKRYLGPSPGDRDASPTSV